jgi:hypothetical protein
MTVADIPSWRAVEWNRGEHHDAVRLPARPLLDWLGPAAAHTVNALGYDRTIIYRWAERGIPDIVADQIACRLGVHPSAIWGDLWWHTAPVPEPEPHNQFCGRNTR